MDKNKGDNLNEKSMKYTKASKLTNFGRSDSRQFGSFLEAKLICTGKGNFLPQTSKLDMSEF